MTPTLLAWLAQVKARKEKASAELARLCKEIWDSGRGWHWEIPANKERDTDLILGYSLDDVPALVKIVEAQARVIEADLRLLLTEPGTRSLSLLTEDRMVARAALAAAIKEATDGR